MSVALALALAGSSGTTAFAQRAAVNAPSNEATAVQQNYGFAHWGPAGEIRAGVEIAHFNVPGLTLRGRTDRMAADGGIALSLGGQTSTTLQVRLAVAPDAVTAREILIRYLRSAQASLVPLREKHGADVAFGDSAIGEHAAAAVFGNIAVWIARTSDAGLETPTAVSVMIALRGALAAPGAPSFATPTLMRAGSQSPTRAMHVDVAGGAFDHIETRVRGGHLRGAAGPAGLDIVPNARGVVEVRVLATDALGRTGQGSLLLRAAASAGPV